MTRASLRFGLVGTGVVAHRFAASLRFCAGARLVAVASRDTSHARELARTFRVERVHATLEELAADAELDVVYVATPIGFHADHTRHCLEAGKAVLCEKPLARSAEEAAQSVETARRLGRFLMEGMWMRFLPLMAELRDRVGNDARGGIGRVRMLQADLAYPIPHDPTNPRFDPANGGGSLLSLGVYPVSLALDLLGRPTAVEGSTLRLAGGVDGQAAMTLSYPDAQAILTCGFHGRGRNDATLVGERGRIRVDEPLYGSEALTLTTWPAPTPAPAPARPARRRSDRLQERLPHSARPYRRLLPGLRRILGRDRRIRRPYSGFGYQFEAAEVVRCMRQGLGESPVMPLDETVAVLEILDRIGGSTRPREQAHGARG